MIGAAENARVVPTPPARICRTERTNVHVTWDTRWTQWADVCIPVSACFEVFSSSHACDPYQDKPYVHTCGQGESSFFPFNPLTLQIDFDRWRSRSMTLQIDWRSRSIGAPDRLALQIDFDDEYGHFTNSPEVIFHLPEHQRHRSKGLEIIETHIL